MKYRLVVDSQAFYFRTSARNTLAVIEAAERKYKWNLIPEGSYRIEKEQDGNYIGFCSGENFGRS